MFAFLLSPLGRLIGVGALSFILGGAGVGWAVGTVYNGRLQSAKAEAAMNEAKAATAAAQQTALWAKNIHDSAVAFQTTQNGLNDQIGTILNDLHHLQARKPLPVGCKPDADRLHSIQSAIDASNNSAAGQRVGSGLPSPAANH